YPGTIDAYERVWLTLAGLTGRVAVALNGIPLGTIRGGAAEFDVTAALGPRNELVFEVEGKTDADGTWGQGALEGRRTAFLRGVRLWVEAGRVRAEGQVVGEAEGPLELYLVVDRHPASYATITASSAGEPFHLQAPAPDGPAFGVKLELVQGAS